MNNIETHYWTPTVKEMEEFQTFACEKHPFNDNIIVKFYQLDPPINVRCPATTCEGEVEYSKQWFKLAKIEAVEVLNRERDAFNEYYEKQLKYNR